MISSCKFLACPVYAQLIQQAWLIVAATMLIQHLPTDSNKRNGSNGNVGTHRWRLSSRHTHHALWGQVFWTTILLPCVTCTMHDAG